MHAAVPCRREVEERLRHAEAHAQRLQAEAEEKARRLQTGLDMRCSASDTPSCHTPSCHMPHASAYTPSRLCLSQARRLQTELDEMQRRLASQPLAPPAPHGAAEDEGEAAVTQALQNVELVMREEEQVTP